MCSSLHTFFPCEGKEYVKSSWVSNACFDASVATLCKWKNVMVIVAMTVERHIAKIDHVLQKNNR